jgi:Mg-chelatase subunit ChlD
MRASSKRFIDQLDFPRGDEAAVFAFSNYVGLIQAFTNDNVALKAAIDSGGVPGAYTIVYDALWSAIDNAATQAKPGNNRAIILISDGKDENADSTGIASVKGLSEVIAHAQAHQVTIYTIGLGTVATDVMTTLANETGGQYFPAPNSAQLDSIYTAIRNIIAGEYTITYISSAAPGGSVLLNVFVNSNGLQGEVSRTVPGCP